MFFRGVLSLNEVTRRGDDKDSSFACANVLYELIYDFYKRKKNFVEFGKVNKFS